MRGREGSSGVDLRGESWLESQALPSGASRSRSPLRASMALSTATPLRSSLWVSSHRQHGDRASIRPGANDETTVVTTAAVPTSDLT